MGEAQNFLTTPRMWHVQCTCKVLNIFVGEVWRRIFHCSLNGERLDLLFPLKFLIVLSTQDHLHVVDISTSVLRLCGRVFQLYFSFCKIHGFCKVCCIAVRRYSASVWCCWSYQINTNHWHSVCPCGLAVLHPQCAPSPNSYLLGPSLIPRYIKEFVWGLLWVLWDWFLEELWRGMMLY